MTKKTLKKLKKPTKIAARAKVKRKKRKLDLAPRVLKHDRTIRDELLAAYRGVDPSPAAVKRIIERAWNAAPETGVICCVVLREEEIRRALHMFAITLLSPSQRRDSQRAKQVALQPMNGDLYVTWR